MNQISHSQRVASKIQQEFPDDERWSFHLLRESNPNLLERFYDHGAYEEVLPRLPLDFLEKYSPRHQKQQTRSRVAEIILRKRGAEVSDNAVSEELTAINLRYLAYTISKLLNEHEVDEWTAASISHLDTTLYNEINRRGGISPVLPYLDLDLLEIYGEKTEKDKAIKYSALVRKLFPDCDENEARLRYISEYVDRNIVGIWSRDTVVEAETMFIGWLKGNGITSIFPYISYSALERYRTGGTSKKVIVELVREFFRRENLDLDEEQINAHVANLEMIWAAERVEAYILSLPGDREWTREQLVNETSFTYKKLARHDFKKILEYLSWPALKGFINVDVRINNFLNELRERKELEYLETTKLVRNNAEMQIRRQTRADCFDFERPCYITECRYNLGDEYQGSTNCTLDIVDQNPNGLTLEEIGQHFGVTRERIRQIEAKALKSLKSRGINAQDLSLEFLTDDEAPIVSLMDFIDSDEGDDYVYPDTNFKKED